MKIGELITKGLATFRWRSALERRDLPALVAILERSGAVAIHDPFRSLVPLLLENFAGQLESDPFNLVARLVRGLAPVATPADFYAVVCKESSDPLWANTTARSIMLAPSYPEDLDRLSLAKVLLEENPRAFVQGPGSLPIGSAVDDGIDPGLMADLGMFFWEVHARPPIEHSRGWQTFLTSVPWFAEQNSPPALVRWLACRPEVASKIFAKRAENGEYAIPRKGEFVAAFLSGRESFWQTDVARIGDDWRHLAGLGLAPEMEGRIQSFLARKITNGKPASELEPLMDWLGETAASLPPHMAYDCLYSVLADRPDLAAEMLERMRVKGWVPQIETFKRAVDIRHDYNAQCATWKTSMNGWRLGPSPVPQSPPHPHFQIGVPLGAEASPTTSPLEPGVVAVLAHLEKELLQGRASVVGQVRGVQHPL